MSSLEKMSAQQLIEEAEKLRETIGTDAEKLRMIFDLLHQKGRSEGAFRFANASMRNLRLASTIHRSLVSIKASSLSEEIDELNEDDQRLAALNKRRDEKKEARRQRVREANKLKIQSLGGGANG